MEDTTSLYLYVEFGKWKYWVQANYDMSTQRNFWCLFSARMWEIRELNGMCLEIDACVSGQLLIHII